MADYFYVGLACLLLGLAAGVYLDHEFHLAGQTVIAEHRAVKAEQGETKMITKTQVVTKDIRNDKTDKCLDAPVPTAINRQL